MNDDAVKSEKETVDSLKEQLKKANEKIDKIHSDVNITKNSKSEGITILLSLILGLIGIMGVGHIYVGKKRLGFGILVGGLILGMYTIVGLNTWGFVDLFPSMKSNLSPEQTTNSLVITFGVSIGYLILYVWQIIHSWKQCKKINELIFDGGEQ